MDSGSISLVTSLGMLLLMSAFFSATETAFTSLSGPRMKNQAAGGSKRAGQVLALAEDLTGYSVLYSSGTIL